MDRYDAIPVQAVEQEVAEWLAEHEPLPRNALSRVESRFLRTVGEPARMDVEKYARLKNPHMRVASATEFGVFAYKEDVVLIELDDRVECGEMVGYPANDSRWVPVLICMNGPVAQARDRMETVVVTLNSLADGELAL